MYIYHALINAMSAHIIHINLNTIFCTMWRTVLPKQFTFGIIKFILMHTHTHTHTCARVHTHTHTHHNKTQHNTHKTSKQTKVERNSYSVSQTVLPRTLFLRCSVFFSAHQITRQNKILYTSASRFSTR